MTTATTLLSILVLSVSASGYAADSPMVKCFAQYNTERQKTTDEKKIALLDKRYEECTAKAPKNRPIPLSEQPGVRIGMTQEQVLNDTNWGRPHRTDRMTTARGTSEWWWYGGSNALHFDNGVLTSIHN